MFLKDFNILKEIGLLEENLSLNLCVGDGNALIHPKIPITKTQFAAIRVTVPKDLSLHHVFYCSS